VLYGDLAHWEHLCKFLYKWNWIICS